MWPKQCAVCLQVKAEAEADQRKGVMDNTVKRSAPDAQTFCSLLRGVHLMSLDETAASSLSGPGFWLETVKAYQPSTKSGRDRVVIT